MRVYVVFDDLRGSAMCGFLNKDEAEDFATLYGLSLFSVEVFNDGESQNVAINQFGELVQNKKLRAVHTEFGSTASIPIRTIDEIANDLLIAVKNDNDCSDVVTKGRIQKLEKELEFARLYSKRFPE